MQYGCFDARSELFANACMFFQITNQLFYSYLILCELLLSGLRLFLFVEAVDIGSKWVLFVPRCHSVS